MARTNVGIKTPKVYTHGGAEASKISAEDSLRRSVMACFLWEDNFYEDGVEIGQRIRELASKVSVDTLIAMAKEARHDHHLRHVPLLLLCEVIKRGKGKQVSDAIYDVVSRADEMAELVSLYRLDNPKKPLDAQLKKGIARCFSKFDAYQLAKYNRKGPITLKTLLKTCRPKPANAERSEIYKKILEDRLESPDTWEVALSSGKDKKETFERLLSEGKLGYLALLRNLRNMKSANVQRKLVCEAIKERKGAHNVLPFRFFAAANAAPDFEPELDNALLANLSGLPKLMGRTIVIVDISGSMRSSLSGKSDLDRLGAACALGAVMREVCDDVGVYATAGNDWKRVHATSIVPARRGMAMADAISGMSRTLGGGGIFLKQVMDYIHEQEGDVERVICITDEQDTSGSDPENRPSNAKLIGNNNYMINVASNKNGIGYKRWTHIDGFSESVVRFIYEYESNK